MSAIIDADTIQAAGIMARASEQIAKSPFADVEPFDAEKWVSDVIGS